MVASRFGEYWFLAFLLVFFLHSPSTAQMGGGGGPPSPEMMIQRMDANGDGRISRGEFRGPPPRFDMLDSDKDGFVTLEEIKAFRAGRGGGKGSGGPVGGATPWLNGQQVRWLMADTEISHISPRSNNHVSMTFKADGSLDGTVGGGTPLTGTWQVRPDGQLCFNASELGNEICFYLIRKGDLVQRLNRRKEPAKGIDWTIVKAGPNAGKVPDGVFQ